MGHRLSRLGGLLVAMVLLLAMAGCQREPEVRVPAGATLVAQSTSAPVSTAGPTASAGGGLISPVGGVTVISALTSEPASDVIGTPAPATSAPAAPTIVLPTPVVAQPEPTKTPSSPSGEYTLYTVQLGDTLFSIAVRFGKTVNELAVANQIQDPSTIFVGQVLKIPTGGTTEPGSGSGQCRYYHTVKPGEWIWQIARTYGADPYAILRANGLTIQSGSTISAGDRLCIP